MSNSLIFGERPERFAHTAHFWWATWAIHSHSSLRKREWANCSFLKKLKLQYYTNFFSKSLVFVSERGNEWFARRNELFTHLLIYLEWPEQIAHSCSFVMSDLSKLLMVTLLSGVTWAICSQSLICPEWSDQITHSCSLVLSNLSEWVNERIPDPVMITVYLQQVEVWGMI